MLLFGRKSTLPGLGRDHPRGPLGAPVFVWALTTVGLRPPFVSAQTLWLSHPDCRAAAKTIRKRGPTPTACHSLRHPERLRGEAAAVV